MKKILFFITALLLMGGLNANATRLYADLSKDVTFDHVSWAALTHTLTWDLSYSNSFALSGFSGDLSSYETITINASGYSGGNEYRLIFYGPNFPLDGNEHKKVLGAFYSNGGTYNLADRGFTKEMLSNVTSINLAGASGGGSIVIERIYFEKPTEFKFDDAGKAYLYPSDLKATSWGLDSYDSETGIVTKSTSGYGGISFDFGELGYDFSNITNIEISIDGEYDDIREYANVTDLNKHTQYISATTAPYTLGDNIDSNIKTWNLGFNQKTGSMKINYICFASNVLKARLGEEAEMSSLTSYHWNSGSGVFEPTGYTPNYRINETTGAAYFGVDYNGENCQNYTDVEGYKAIRIYSAKGNVPRAMFFNSNATNQQQFNFVWNDEGYYELQLSEVYSSVSNYKLISVRPQQYTSSSINGIYIVTNDAIYNYGISGSGIMTSSATAALADASATCYDATGVTGSGVSLDAANKNALFKANKDVLANTSNVIVDNTIANLVLTDGGGTFKTSEGYFATSASFNREFTAGKRSTVCLPYGLSAEEASAAGDFYQFTGVEDSKLVFTKISATKPYEPFLFKAKADGVITTTESKDIQASVYAYTSYEVSGYTFKGVLANSSDVAADNPGMTVYGWDAETGDFIKVGENVSINAFRAYITISNENANPARLAAKFVDDSITGINEVNGSEAKNADGKFFENGKIVIIKNGVKYSAAGVLLK
jgi:hypothetical protein